MCNALRRDRLPDRRVVIRFDFTGRPRPERYWLLIELKDSKFVDIKCRKSRLRPSAAVLMGTARALKYSGGAKIEDVNTEDTEALMNDLAHMDRHVKKPPRQLRPARHRRTEPVRCAACPLRPRFVGLGFRKTTYSNNNNNRGDDPCSSPLRPKRWQERSGRPCRATRRWIAA
jgi:hypothetical protein